MYMIPHKQLSIADIFSDCQEKFENDKYQFLSLLESTINLNKFIPISFKNHFYASTVRPREYSLNAMLLQIRKSSNYISIGIFAIFTSLVW